MVLIMICLSTHKITQTYERSLLILALEESRDLLLWSFLRKTTSRPKPTKHNTWTDGREEILRSSLKLGPGLTDILYLIYRGKSL